MARTLAAVFQQTTIEPRRLVRRARLMFWKLAYRQLETLVMNTAGSE
jgi:hypothetical protein